MSTFFWILWRAVQTEQFGLYLSNKIKKTVYSKAGLNVSFERVDISLFPPSTTMRSFEVFEKETKTTLKANYLGVSFGLSDLISPNLSFGEVFLKDAKIISESRKSNKKKDEVKIEEIFKMYNEIYTKKMQVRVKRLKVEDAHLVIDGHELNIRNFKASLFPDLLTSEGIVENVILKDKRGPVLDQLSYDVQLNEEGLRIKKFTILDGINKFDIMGKALLEKNIGLNLIFQYVGDKNIKALSLLKDIPKELVESDGNISIDGKISGTAKSPKVKTKLVFSDLVTEFVLLDKLVVNVDFEDNIVSINSIRAEVNGGLAESNINKPAYNIKTKEVLLNSITANVKNLHSNDFLYAIKEDLNPLKLKFNGDVELFHEENLGVRIQPKIGARLIDVKLFNKRENEIIIEPRSDLVWDKGRGLVVLFEKGVLFDAGIKINESDLAVKGKIIEEIEIETKSEYLNLYDIGPISGTSLRGDGKMEMKISGPPENVFFISNFDIKNFNVVDINLGEIKGDFTFGLEELLLNIKINDGRYLSSLYNGSGNMRFEGDENLDIDVTVTNGSYKDIEEMAPLVFENIKQYTNPFNATIKGKMKLFGGFKKNLLGVKGHVEGSGKYQKELIDSYRLNFNYHKEKLKMNNIVLNKTRGNVSGNANFNFIEDNYNYLFNVRNILLRDFQNINDIGLGYDGLLNGKVSGAGTTKTPDTKIDLKITNGKIGENSVADSIVSLHRTGEEYFVRSNIFQGEIVFNSFIDFNKKKNKKSTLSLKVDTMNLRKMLGVLSLHNLDDRDMSGAIKLFGDAEFDANDILSMDASIKLDFLRWYKKKELLEIDNPIDIKIEKGEIKQWDLQTNSLSRNYFKMKGEGNLSKKVKIDSDFKISSIFADVLTEKLNFREGILDGRLRIIGERGRFSTYLDLSGERMVLKPIGLRTPLNDLNFKVILDGENININSLESNLGGGKLLATGNGTLKFPYPRLKIIMDGKNIRQPLFKKSYFVFDSTLTLEGDELPYLVTGKANVKNALVRDELKDMKDDSLVNQGYRKYIPKAAIDKENAPFKLNIDAIISEPIVVKNSLLDIKLTGKVNVSNTLKNTLYSGDVDLASNKNLLYLKGHEFEFSNGKIMLVPSQEEQKIKLDFLASSKINEYDVFTDIKGTTDDLIVEMYSRPDLSQGDLLSLVTLGVTSDVSQNLGERERQSVTTLGLGGIVLDQLGINQNLNKSFGLKVSVAPEIEEDDGSLLRGRAENAGSETSMKTGTKIQVKKELADKVDLSLSSTVGGAAKQKQEMNVDVKINDSFSLEGVYEMRSTDELEEENPDSIGADLKWRFSF